MKKSAVRQPAPDQLSVSDMERHPSIIVRKVQKRSTEAQAADTLREAIIAGDIPLGTRLTEIAVSEKVGVSRGTIRTAFHQLVQEGLLVQVPYTGWTVMQLSSHDAWELYTLRASLESLASRLVARRISAGTGTVDVRSAITNAFSELVEACKTGDKRRIAQSDMGLHGKIVLLSNHKRLIDQYSKIEHQIRLYIQSSDALVLNAADIVKQHEPIVATILQGDEDNAVVAAAAHNEREGAILVNHLLSIEDD